MKKACYLIDEDSRPFRIEINLVDESFQLRKMDFLD